MSKNYKIGLVTYQRPEYCQTILKNLNSLTDDKIIVYQDGELYDFVKIDPGNIDIILNDNEKQHGPSYGKNRILEAAFINKDIDYVFLLEDDITFKSKDVFQKYIELSQLSDVHVLTYVGSSAGSGEYQNRNPLGILKYHPDDNKPQTALYPNMVGAFTLVTRKCWEKIGQFDEKFFSAFHESDYYYRASLKGLAYAFWLFPDLANSDDYIEPILGSVNQSKCGEDPRWNMFVQEGLKYWKQKHGIGISEIPRLSLEDFYCTIRKPTE